MDYVRQHYFLLIPTLVLDFKHKEECTRQFQNYVQFFSLPLFYQNTSELIFNFFIFS